MSGVQLLTVPWLMSHEPVAKSSIVRFVDPLNAASWRAFIAPRGGWSERRVEVMSSAPVAKAKTEQKKQDMLGAAGRSCGEILLPPPPLSRQLWAPDGR